MTRPLPKTLQRWADTHPDQFDEGWTEQDDFGPYRRPGAGASWSHWIYLKPGWCSYERGMHIVHEWTVSEALAVLRGIKPCTCPDCEEAQP